MSDQRDGVAEFTLGHENAGPTRSGDLSVEWRGIQPVPATARYGRPQRMGGFWFAAQLLPVPFFIGALGGTSFIGLSFWTAAVAIVVGNVLGNAIVAALSVMGPRTGVAQIPLARAAFGRSVTVVGLLAYVVSIVFLALGAVFGAEALETLFGLPFVVDLILVFALEGLISVVGYELLHKYETVTAVLSGIGFLVLMIVVLSKVGDIHIAATAHGAVAVGSFVLMAAIAFSYSIAWAPYAADYCRYLPENVSSRSLMAWVFGGLTVGCVWIEILGLAAGSLLSTNVSQMRGVFDLMGGGILGYAVLLAIYLGVVANLTATDYSAGLQILSTGVKVPRPWVTGASAVIAFVLTLWLHSGGDLLSKAENLILLVTYWIGPFVGIVAVHWWRHSVRSHVEAARMPFGQLPSGIAALISLVVGFVVCLPFSDTTQGAELAAHGGILNTLFGSISNGLDGADLAYPVGILVGALVYAVLTARRVSSPAEAAPTP
jgi:nucleobase:cation symporter-1, NCS1 family